MLGVRGTYLGLRWLQGACARGIIDLWDWLGLLK
jgi:hypothetical protein